MATTDTSTAVRAFEEAVARMADERVRAQMKRIRDRVRSLLNEEFGRGYCDDYHTLDAAMGYVRVCVIGVSCGQNIPQKFIDHHTRKAVEQLVCKAIDVQADEEAQATEQRIKQLEEELAALKGEL